MVSIGYDSQSLMVALEDVLRLAQLHVVVCLPFGMEQHIYW